MNLYEIIFEHYSQKDSQSGILTYLLASSDEEVYEWLKSDPTLPNKKTIVTSYSDFESDNKLFKVYGKDLKVIGKETFKERIIRLKGDINDEETVFENLYYGMTLYGWRLVKQNCKKTDYNYLKKLGVCVTSAK